MLDVSALADAIRAQYPDLSITFSNSRTLTVQWDDSVCTRAEWLQTIAGQLPNAEYVATSTRSSVGHVRIDGTFTLLAKPAHGTHPLSHESAAIHTLHTAIRSYVATTSQPATIVLPLRNSPTSNVIYTFTNIVAAQKVERVPKADCVLLDTTDTPVCWLSLKAGTGPEAFQQYAGISPSADGSVTGCISTDPEVLSFVHELVPRHSLILTNRQRFYRPITSEHLIARAVFGPAYGAAYGEDHVHAIGQGIPHLISRQDATMALCFSGACIVSGDVAHFQVGAYQAVLGARYQGRRRFVVDGQQYRDVRVGIMPKRLIATARSQLLPPETTQ